METFSFMNLKYQKNERMKIKTMEHKIMQFSLFSAVILFFIFFLSFTAYKKKTQSFSILYQQNVANERKTKRKKRNKPMCLLHSEHIYYKIINAKQKRDFRNFRRKIKLCECKAQTHNHILYRHKVHASIIFYSVLRETCDAGSKDA